MHDEKYAYYVKEFDKKCNILDGRGGGGGGGGGRFGIPNDFMIGTMIIRHDFFQHNI